MGWKRLRSLAPSREANQKNFPFLLEEKGPCDKLKIREKCFALHRRLAAGEAAGRGQSAYGFSSKNVRTSSKKHRQIVLSAKLKDVASAQRAEATNLDFSKCDSWRTRMQPIRTISEISAHIKILPTRQIPLYQKISLKTKQLRTLGMSYQQIAKSSNVGETYIKRAYKHKRDIK